MGSQGMLFGRLLECRMGRNKTPPSSALSFLPAKTKKKQHKSTQTQTNKTGRTKKTAQRFCLKTTEKPGGTKKPVRDVKKKQKPGDEKPKREAERPTKSGAFDASAEVVKEISMTSQTSSGSNRRPWGFKGKLGVAAGSDGISVLMSFLSPPPRFLFF